jgi:hypothetical protein
LEFRSGGDWVNPQQNRPKAQDLSCFHSWAPTGPLKTKAAEERPYEKT